MAWHPKARRMRLDGTEVVVLTPEDFERLEGFRRRSGAQTNRERGLRHKLAAATAMLEEARQAGCSDGAGSTRPGCILDSITGACAFRPLEPR